MIHKHTNFDPQRPESGYTKRGRGSGLRRSAALLLIFVMASAGTFGCGQKDEMSVEDEVTLNLEKISEDDSSVAENTDTAQKTDDAQAAGAGEEEQDALDSEKDTPATGPVSKQEQKILVSENPFLGYNSTSDSYDIKFKIETDSGVAGILWGVDPKEDDSEYYLWAFDLTRDIPRLYTCRRNGDEVYDEVYTNLDMMYPEMNMFTGGEHIVEISVSGTAVTTYLDSMNVFETQLDKAVSIGRIGTWVTEGDYYAYFDDLDIREGADGSGDYLYVDDFSAKACIFPSTEGTENGRFRAPAGITLIPAAE